MRSGAGSGCTTAAAGSRSASTPDLSAWSKAIANGYPLAATLGTGRYADAASQIFVTGSFWYQAVPHAACVATLNAVRDEGAVDTMVKMGTLLREGLAREAAEAGVAINQTGPVQMPNLSFIEDENFAKAQAFCAAAIAHGVIFHPRHNWFVSGGAHRVRRRTRRRRRPGRLPRGGLAVRH